MKAAPTGAMHTAKKRKGKQRAKMRNDVTTAPNAIRLRLINPEINQAECLFIIIRANCQHSFA